jgi:hypothetical protein
LRIKILKSAAGAASYKKNRYLFSNSKAATKTPPPGVNCRSFSAMTAFSETVAELNFRLKIFTFFRRCRRRRISLRRSLLLT